ncbi:unnamed protein product [Porites evermanni]|uniref:Reverse transcriptase n=1 Tax=Porites evermanni TaxID=104178 RepID=A0ABN8QV42_9CNID|nr:unnamed protein product [Porites evermanni]
MRSTVRSWLKLPKDTSIAFFHAKAIDGGLSLPLPEHKISLMKQAKTARMAMSPDPVVCAMLETPATHKVLRAKQTSLNGTVVATRQGLRSVLAQQLHSLCDERGLATAPQVPAQNQWVTSGDMTLNGHTYIGAIKIRGNLVATAYQPHTDIRCNCCGNSESLGHILQTCPRTYASCIARHDKIVDQVRSGAERIGYGIRREPAIQTPAGIRKPDLVLVRDGDLTILDITIVAHNADLDKAHHDKSIMTSLPLESGPNHATSLGALPLRL